MLAIEFTGNIGIGTIITILVIAVSTTALFLKWRQGDPSEWRENYLGEVTRREELEKTLAEQRERKHQALTEVATLKAQTNLTPLMEAMLGLQSAQERSE